MNVLVDSSIWSLAMRRRRAHLSATETPLVREWDELVLEGRIAIIGLIRQEVLSGIAVTTEFERLRLALRQFPDVPVQTADHERAAELFNYCRSRGIQGSHTDLLICAVAERYSLAVFSRDGDFAHFAMVVPIAIHAVRPEFRR